MYRHQMYLQDTEPHKYTRAMLTFEYLFIKYEYVDYYRNTTFNMNALAPM